MAGVGKDGRYPDELRLRATRMVFDHAHEYPSQRKAIESIAEKLDGTRDVAELGAPRRGRRRPPAGAHDR